MPPTYMAASQVEADMLAEIAAVKYAGKESIDPFFLVVKSFF